MRQAVVTRLLVEDVVEAGKVHSISRDVEYLDSLFIVEIPVEDAEISAHWIGVHMKRVAHPALKRPSRNGPSNARVCSELVKFLNK